MTNPTDRENDIIRLTQRSIRWRPYTRAVEFVIGVGLLILTFWAANDRAVFEWLTGGGGLFGLLGALGATATIGALRDRGHKRDKLLIRLVGDSDVSAS